MHAGQLPMLFTAALLCSLAQAETPQQPASSPAVAAATNDALVARLQRQLAESERQRNELSSRLEAASTALRQENQRLKLQLEEARALQAPRLLSEQQTWFAVGAGVALLSLTTGLIARGGRRQRRQWIN